MSSSYCPVHNRFFALRRPGAWPCWQAIWSGGGASASLNRQIEGAGWPQSTSSQITPQGFALQDVPLGSEGLFGYFPLCSVGGHLISAQAGPSDGKAGDKARSEAIVRGPPAKEREHGEWLGPAIRFTSPRGAASAARKGALVEAGSVASPWGPRGGFFSVPIIETKLERTRGLGILDSARRKPPCPWLHGEPSTMPPAPERCSICCTWLPAIFPPDKSKSCGPQARIVELNSTRNHNTN